MYFFPVFLGVHHAEHGELRAQKVLVGVADFDLKVVEVLKAHEAVAELDGLADLDLEEQLVQVGCLQFVF